MRPYFRTFLYFATVLLFAMACTKEVTLFTEVEFELSVEGEQEGYVNQLLPTTVRVTPEESLEGYEYTYTYALVSGNGYFENRSGEVLPSGEQLSLEPLSASMMFRGIEVGEHVVKITAEDNFGFTEEAELTYSVTNVPAVWTASPESANIEVNDEFTFTLALDTADAEVTYESRYSLVSGSGILTGLPAAGDVVSQEFRPITAGSYPLSFTPDTRGAAVLTFDLRDSNGQEISVSVNLEVFEEGTLVAVTGLNVLPESADLEIGGTQQLTAEIIPDNATEQGVVWTSENTGIATVDANGRVTAVSAGTVSINAVSVEDSAIRDSATLTVTEATVNQPPMANDDTISTGAGEGVNITVLQNDTDVDTPVEQLTITAVSEVTPTGAAMVSINGSAISFEPTAGVTGEVTFTYTINDGNPGNNATATVTVNVMENIIAVTGIIVTPETATIIEGGNRQLDATVSPTDATEQGVVWSSSNAAIATVDNTGRVIAIAPGEAVITAASVDDNSITDSATITVNPDEVLVSGITVTRDRSSIPDNETEPFTAIVAPANATDPSVTWSSSNTSVATVNASTGLVTAVAAGSATITATANDGSTVTGTAGITVTASEILVGSITVSSLRSSIPDNETEQFNATVTPGNATDQSVSWSSSNTGVATVNPATGLVTAVTAGTTNITATANDGSGVSGSKTLAVTSTNTPPTVTLRENNLVPTGAFPKTINFAITSSNDDGTIVSYAWDFEGSSAPEITNATDQNVSYEYNAPGNYSVTIVVTDDDGATGTDTIDFTLDEPVAEYTFNENTGLFTAPAGAVINISVETTGEVASGRFNVGTSPNSQNIEALATATGLTCAPEVDCGPDGEGIDFATGNFTMPSNQVYFSFSHTGGSGSSSVMSFTFNSSGGTNSILVD